ncbi:DUF2971 domain-containing protein (plasmid) [Bacillus sp. PK9-021]
MSGIKLSWLLKEIDKELETYEVNDDTILIRYMDFSKFISFLENGLYLTRADKFEDPLEGAVPSWYSTLPSHSHIYSQEEKERRLEKAKVTVEEASKLRGKAFISCWNEYEDESYALWQIYAKYQGIAIQTTKNKLEKLLQGTSSKIYRVKYMKEAKGMVFAPELDEGIADNVPMNFFVHKKKHYTYEQEVRVIQFNEKSELDPIEIPDLNDFIDKIYISPFADVWFPSLVQKLIKERYKLNIEVEKSAIEIFNR